MSLLSEIDQDILYRIVVLLLLSGCYVRPGKERFPVNFQMFKMISRGGARRNYRKKIAGLSVKED